MARMLTLTIAVLALAAAPALSLVTTVHEPSPLSDLAGEEKQMAGPFEYCGDVQAIFKNPDLQPAEDGFVHASGWFFIQFQIVADDPAFTVDRLGFSFGKPIPDALRTCDAPVWITDAYYKDYRVDDDPSDGFFIPINTTNVPDGEYGAAISVYVGGEEIGRGYTRAVVKNGCQVIYDPRNPLGCTIETLRENDKVRPWPIVLPGDGQAIASGLTIEFAEQVRDVHAAVNGVEVPLAAWEGRQWDNDRYAAALDEDAPACADCQDWTWGPDFQWNGEVPDGSIITVRATDMSNNTVDKIIHLSSSAVGGIISVQLPKLEVKTPEATLHASVGQVAEFDVTFVNVGKDEAHTNLFVDAVNGLEAFWDPAHAVIASSQETVTKLKATSTREGTYRINAYAEYKAGTEDVRVEVPLTLIVGKGGEVVTSDATDETLETTESEDTDDSPGFGLVFALAGVAVAALVLRRRR